MANVLIDTETLIAYLTEPARLAPDIHARLDGAQQSGVLAISVATLLELDEMRRRGSLDEASLRSLEERLVRKSLEVIPIDLGVIRDLSRVPTGVGPVDRILAATAFARTLDIVTANVALRIPGLEVQSPWPATLQVLPMPQ